MDVDVPEDRCGYTIEDPDLVRVADFERSDRWRLVDGHICCWRSVWRADRCVWHANVGRKPVEDLEASRTDDPERLDGAVLRDTGLNDRISFEACGLIDADCTEGTFLYADFAGAKLVGANFQRATLTKSDFSEAELWGADFWEAEAWDVDFTDADLWRTDLRRANLEDTTFTRADIRGAELEGAKLYQALFPDTRINDQTEFGERCVYETDPETGVRYEDVRPLQAAALTYQRLERLHSENALSSEARRLHERKQETTRKDHKQQGNYKERGLLELSRWISKYNDSPLQVVKTSLAVITVAAMLFPFGGLERNGTDVHFLAILADLPGSLPEAAGVFAESVLFSTATFTSLGYPDVQPTGMAKALAAVESLVGALLLALLVFVLGRRTSL